MSAKLNFYSAWFCPFAQRAWIALLEKDVAFEYIEYNPYKEKSDEFLRLNPRGLVSVLEVNGQSVYESDVCIEFIDEYGGATNRLLPLRNNPCFLWFAIKTGCNTQKNIKSSENAYDLQTEFFSFFRW